MYRRIVAAKARRAWRKIAEGDRSAATSIARPDIHFQFVGDTPLGADIRGVEGFEQWFDDAVARVPGLSFEVHDVLVGGWPWDTRVAVRLGISAPLPDGDTYRNVGVQWLRLRWGRIVDDWVLEDTLALTKMLDRLEASSAA